MSVLLAVAVSVAFASESEPPANDDFAQATAFKDRGRNDIAEGKTLGATREPGEPAHGGFSTGTSVWFTWTAEYSGTAEVYPCNGNFHPIIDVYTGATVSALTQVSTPIDIGQRNEFCTLGGRGGAALSAVAGQTYHVAVDAAPGEGGWFTIIALDAPIPPRSATPRIGKRIGIAGHRAKIRFQADMAEAKFLCKLDRDAAVECTSPATFTSLRPGAHRIAVTAIGEPGASILPPAVRHFWIPKDRSRR